MNTWAIRIVLLVLLSVGDAVAEPSTLVVPLAGLEGRYVTALRETVVQEVRVSFSPPREITSLCLRISGTAIPGIEECTSEQYLSGVEFLGRISGSSLPNSELAFDIYTWDAVEFAAEEDCTSMPLSANLTAQILSGELTLRLAAYMPITWCAYVPPYAEATIDSASLVIEGDFVVPVDDLSWGAAKANYR